MTPVNRSTAETRSATERFLDAIETVGNRVPHPAVIFVLLIAIVIALSHILYMLGVSVNYQVINPD
jgi:aminobenzoyl-glutamate transport protein